MASPEIWLPDSPEALSEFQSPTPSELRLAWGGNVMNPSDTVAGVIELPTAPPENVLALDADEIFRLAGESLLRISGGDISNMKFDSQSGYHDYGSRLSNIPNSKAQKWRQLLLQQFMNYDVVQPVPYASAIRSFLKKWQKNGTYIFANTSTLPGCELATIRFLHKHFPGNFQGIMLPGNHDGKGKTTKVDALSEVMKALDTRGLLADDVSVIAVDDAKHHIEAYQAAGILTFVPEYGWNAATKDLPNVRRIINPNLESTFETFVAIDAYLSQL